MKHGIEKCRICENYLVGLDTCKFCSFELCDDYPPCNDDEFDILDLNDDVEWSHLQILDRLHSKGLSCSFADIWSDNNIAMLLGCNVFTSKIAEVLGVHEESIYNWTDQAMIIINLYQERCVRENEKEKDNISIDWEMTKKIFDKKGE